MNSRLRIELQIAVKNGEQIAGVGNSIRTLGNTARAAGDAIEKGFGAKFLSSSQGIMEWGRRVQWTGRQIEFSFTLPLIHAARAVGDLALENEKALTRIAKVYDVAGDSTERLNARFVEMGTQLKQRPQDMTALQATAFDLGRGIRVLSDTFGVNMADVSKLAGMWAAAGATGANLADAVKLTMEAMTVGDLGSTEDAFKTLITLQSAYNLKTTELRGALALVNTADNVTAASFGDLTVALSRAGGAASATGVDLVHLLAMVSSLVPATGSAENAGNALKTMFSRLTKPTQDAIDAMKRLGVNFFDASFQSLNVTQRMELLAEKIKTVGSQEAAVIQTYLFGNYQLSRGITLLDDIGNANGNYQRVLAATRDGVIDTSKSMQIYNNAITTVLKSTPQGLQIARTQIKNMGSSLLVDLLPAFVMVVGLLRQFINWFGGLDDGTKKIILLGVAFIAITGPILRYIGASFQLLGVLGKVIAWLGVKLGIIKTTQAAEVVAAESTAAANAATEASYGSLLAIQKAVMAIAADTGVLALGAAAVAEEAAASAAAAAATAEVAAGAADAAATEAVAAEAAAAAPVLAVAAIVAAIIAAVGAAVYLLVKYRSQVWDAMVWLKDKTIDIFHVVIDWIIKAWNALPGAIVKVFTAVVQIVAGAMKIVAHWLSYLNPFARHSPSLVEQVNAGVDAIAAKYATLSDIGSVFRSAIADIEAFKNASAGLGLDAETRKRGKVREDVAAQAPDLLPSLDSAYAATDRLSEAQGRVKVEMDNQEAVVNQVQKAYDALGKQLDAANKSFNALRKAASDAKEQLDAAQKELDNFASAPIAGMKAMEDQIFANDMAQKALRLEMMKLEDVTGPVDQVHNKIALLQGDMETLQAMSADLRKGGAGSEITGPINAQIQAYQAQKTALQAQVAPLDALNNQIDQLQRQAEELNLEKALKFEPLQHQIADLVNTTKELTFEEIITGINTTKPKVAALTQAYNDATAKADAQKLVVDTLSAAHDAMGQTLDDEKAKLADLKDAYAAFADQLKTLEGIISDVGTAASDKAAGAASLANQIMDAAAGGGDLPDAGLGVPSFDQAGADDLKAKVDDWLKQLQDSIGKVDVWGFFKDKLKELGGWIVDQLDKLGHLTVDGIVNLGKLIWKELHKFGPWIWQEMQKAWDGILNTFKDTAPKVVDEVKKLPGQILDAVKVVGPWLWDHFKSALGSAKDGAISGAQDLINWFAGLPKMVLEALPGIATWLYDKGKELLGGMGQGVSDAGPGFIQWFIDLPQRIWDTMTTIATWLLDKGKDLLGGLLQGIIDKGPDVMQWWLDLPGKVLNWIGDAFTYLPKKGKDFLVGFINGLEDKAPDVWQWWIDLPGNVLSKIGDVTGKLIGKGTEILGSFLTGIVAKAPDIWNWWIGLPGTIIEKIGPVLMTLWNTGWNLLQGFWEGILAFIPKIWGWLWDLPGTIKDKTPDMSRTLYHAGEQVMQGLIDGIESFVKNDKLGAVLRGISTYIPLVKGPPSHDAVMLYDNGQLIMQGLVEGIQSGIPGLEQQLKGVTNLIGRSSMDVSVNGSASAPSYNSSVKTLQFNGDLSFPNIQSGDDAKDFIRNLEALAGA